MIAAFQRASRVYLDSAALIYFVEENVDYGPLVEPLIETFDRGTKLGLCSYITLLEVLVKPFELRRLDLAERYRDLLLSSENMRVLPVERTVAEEAARLRAERRVRTPDAIQLATARLAGAEIFVTNDGALPGIPGLEVVLLRNYL